MDYRSAMQLCENYIHAHIGEPLTAKALADMTGYSLYHFCHVFRAYFDMPVGEYVRRCALCKAALDIVGGKSITDAAFDAGFSTSAGFSKAFRRQFGMSAAEYRKNNKNFKGRSDNMNVTIEKKEAFSAIGYHIPPKDGSKVNALEAGAYWYGVDFKDYPQYPADTAEGKPSSAVNGEIGAWTHPNGVDGKLNYFFGYVADSAEVPNGFVKFEVPAAEYAVFDVPPASNHTDGGEEFAGNIRKVWQYVFKEWMDSSEYVFDETKVCFEFYHGDSTKVYVPVVKK